MSRSIWITFVACSVVGTALVACSPNNNGGGSDSGVVVGDGSTTINCNGGTITLTLNAPDCLWAPNHDMVLFTLADVTTSVTGSCTAPTLSIVGVTSNQPDTGGGQGNASPDFTFSSSGVCLRSEREGTSSAPRVYTITFDATDGTNTTTQSITITAPHDESTRCAKVDSSRVVADGDPRCN